jgi:hypothetical protein
MKKAKTVAEVKPTDRVLVPFVVLTGAAEFKKGVETFYNHSVADHDQIYTIQRASKPWQVGHVFLIPKTDGKMNWSEAGIVEAIVDKCPADYMKRLIAEAWKGKDISWVPCQ